MSTFHSLPKIWKHLVDDTFVIIKKNAIDGFLQHLNGIEDSIKLTMEIETDGMLPFFGTMVKCIQFDKWISVYRTFAPITLSNTNNLLYEP